MVEIIVLKRYHIFLFYMHIFSYIFRFSKENVSKRHPMSFIPFGAGPRDCFGQSYAKLAVKIAVVSLIQKYKFSLSSKQNVSNNILQVHVILWATFFIQLYIPFHQYIFKKKSKSMGICSS